MSTDLTHDDVQSILKMIDAAEHLEEIEIVHGNFRLHVIRNGNGSGGTRGSTPAAAVAYPAASSIPTAAKAQAPAQPAMAELPIPDGLIAVRAPMLGVFYRASAPGEKPFIETGQRVGADDTVCLIEVMKLFNSIRAGINGEIVEILAENGAMVEFDQPLIYIRPGKG